jgi:hypothetical protein
VESCQALDVNYLQAKGCLQPGWAGTCQLAHGERAALISLHCEADRLHLSWHLAGEGEGGEREGVTEVILIVCIPWRFGGSRAYFLCPGGCERRVDKLYLSQRRFRCRQCSKLVYACVYEHSWQRASRRASKLWQRLDITETGVPEKPHGMLVSDYARLLDAVLQAETQATEACTARLQQLTARIGNRSRKPRSAL